MPARDYASTRYSPLTDIDVANVASLRRVLTFSTGVLRGHEAAPIVVGGMMYAGRGVRRVEAASFALGWITLAVALFPPLDSLTHHSFALHMVQHEILRVVAAPLLVFGRPLEAWPWSLPPGVPRSLRDVTHARPLRHAWRTITTPLGAWTFHALSVWLWHLPVLFRLALESVPLHVLQHGCFFGAALAFWWAAFGKRTRAPTAASIASLFTTMLHTSALGALLTLAPTVWYSMNEIPALGLTPLEDQPLGGLVMRVPGGLGYMIVGRVVGARWLAPAGQGVNQPTSTAA